MRCSNVVFMGLLMIDLRALVLKQLDGCEMTCFHDEVLEKEMPGTMPGTVPSRSDLRLTTVGKQLDAVHKTRVVRGQEERRSGNLFRLADTTHRHL